VELLSSNWYASLFRVKLSLLSNMSNFEDVVLMKVIHNDKTRMARMIMLFGLILFVCFFVVVMMMLVVVGGRMIVFLEDFSCNESSFSHRQITMKNAPLLRFGINPTIKLIEHHM